MNRFLFATHAEERAPSGCGRQQNATLFLREPLAVAFVIAHSLPRRKDANDKK